MSINYLIRFTLLFICIVISQNSFALTPSFEKKMIEKASLSKNSTQRTHKKSNKKTVFEAKSTKLKSEKRKIPFRKKLSILKLVLKNKASDTHSYKAHYKKNVQKWNGQHTAGLLSWASVLVAVMGFFTGHFLLGILALCSSILFLVLIFVEKGNMGTVDDLLWIFSQIINIIVIIGTIFD